MKVPARLGAWSRALFVALVCGGCPHRDRAATTVPSTAPQRPTFTASRVRSFSDSYAVTAIADSPSALFAGTPRGLLRWEGGRWSVLTQRDGLPADRVAGLAIDGADNIWVATAKGLSRGQRGAWSNYAAAPVGSFMTGIAPSVDGKIVWAGGPEGLARLSRGKWERFFPDTSVTTLAAGMGGWIWVGTSGSGILRIARGGDKIEKFGPSQGCEIDVVRGMVALNKTLFVVGEGPGGARAALFDGERFYSYTLTSPSVIEWAARAGSATLLGAGDHVYELSMTPRAPDETRAPAMVKLGAIPSWIVAPRAIALRPEVPSTALDDPANAPRPQPAPTRPKSGAALPPTGMPLTVYDAPWSMPDGVTTVAGSPRGLLVGTRFLGAMRVENGVPRRFETQDLALGAVRLTVACAAKGNDECYLATGSTRAWRFDGQGFEVAPIDPEPGSRVLALLLDPKGDVLAIHRGAQETERQLRLSRVSDGRWTPVGIQNVTVPEGAPELNFAAFAPDGHLWVGLRYTDREHDARDYGAHEIALDSGKVIRHQEVPTDLVAMYWKARNEAWFATRSGAARLRDGKVRVFTENDGMESDIARAIGPGPGNTILVATGRGTGRYDGVRWTFPRLGPYYPAANSLAHDATGDAFIGTVRGLYCVGDCSGDPIDKRRGLLDDDVHDVVVDQRNRVWVLTGKGINVVEP